MASVVMALASAGFVALLIQALRPAALQVGLVDAPGGRKRHQGSIPLIGGVAIVLAFALSSLIFVPIVAPYRPLFVGLALLVIIGVMDDLRELAPRNKLAHQFIAAVLMTSWGGNYLRDLGMLWGEAVFDLRDWGIPFTLFAALSVINAYNMSDGVDGLAGGWALITFAMMAYLGAATGQQELAAFSMILVGCLGGFLVFNLRHPWRQRAAVFLGDAGSMAIGFLVLWFSVELTQPVEQGEMRVPPVVMLWVCGLALIDMFVVTLRRMSKRRNPLHADRTHLHHVLIRIGFSDRRVVFFLMLVNGLLGMIGIVGWHYGASELVLFLCFLALTGAYLYAASHAWRLSRFARRHLRRNGAAHRQQNTEQ
ncbi:MAG: undecaprenyl/decaprenyl-phosphate alpha-N-acetylglucosaminyl 1-phosphate transferase [Rhodocyclaceae bacterium]|nr:undecaprenyl/decaprenyl-phosphate alpha-N-acetylglucosaminyl 1-phosphate transferase [Rhodocyclaceae bacterium]